MILELQIRIVYGTERIYPVNDKAKKIAQLLNRKTLTRDDIPILKEIGFELKWVAVELP